ncbi:MAG: glycerophosphodiester phosphodiesterase [Gemmatimonadota bacterium]
MVIIGHRGASGHAPEHTIPSYDRALEIGVDYIEQDLQMTRDGVLVVMHDPTLDRTTACSGPLIERSLAEIKQCDAGSWFSPEFAGTRVPTLREVFERYGKRASYYIETKNPAAAPGMEEALLALIEEFDLRTGAIENWQVLIQSFSTERLLKIRRLDPQLPVIQLIESGYDSAAIRARLDHIRSYAVGIGPARTSVDSDLIEVAHAHGLVVHPYTVNEPDEMRRLIGLGVDGIFTDYPDRVKRLDQMIV